MWSQFHSFCCWYYFPSGRLPSRGTKVTKGGSHEPIPLVSKWLELTMLDFCWILLILLSIKPAPLSICSFKIPGRWPIRGEPSIATFYYEMVGIDCARFVQNCIDPLLRILARKKTESIVLVLCWTVSKVSSCELSRGEKISAVGLQYPLPTSSYIHIRVRYWSIVICPGCWVYWVPFPQPFSSDKISNSINCIWLYTYSLVLGTSPF